MKRTIPSYREHLAWFGLCLLTVALWRGTPLQEPSLPPEDPRESAAAVAPTTLEPAYVTERFHRDPTLNPLLSCDLISPELGYDRPQIYRHPQPEPPEFVPRTPWRSPMQNSLLEARS